MRAINPGRLAGGAVLASGAASLLLLGWRLLDGLGFISFMDEATHVVGGRVLNNGGLLYRDFIDTHGPLIFALAQGYGAVFGWSDNNGLRGLIAACAVLAVASLAVSPAGTSFHVPSPAARSTQARACGLILGCGLLASVWLRQGLFLVSFYPVAGALASIGLSGFVAGACLDRFPGRTHAVAAGVAVSLLAGTAYSFLPCIAAFVSAGCWAACTARAWRALGGFLGGLALGGLLMALWMLRFADLHGFLSYHLAENQLVYSRYIGFGWRTFGHGLIPSVLPAGRARSLGIACLLLSLSGLGVRGARRGPLLLVIGGVLSLNARGSDDFQNGSFLWASITLAALVAMRAAAGRDGAWSRPARPLPVEAIQAKPARFKTARVKPARVKPGHAMPGRAPPILVAPICVVLVLASMAFLRGALFQPFGMTETVIRTLPRWRIGDRSDNAFFATIRHYARPGEPILGLIYQPQIYLLADRLPMDGFYAWFPWDADYARSPRFGRGRDLCRALADHPPPVIVLDPMPLWNYAPFTVAPCLPAILHDRYQADQSVADLHGILYARRDRTKHP